MYKFIGFILVTLALVGCLDSTQVIPGPGAAKGKIERGATALISIPKDGRYRRAEYHGSGEQTARILAGAFSEVLERVEVAEGHADRDASIRKAKELGLKYLIQPRITHWEDRATAWSLISDKVTVSIAIIEVASGKTVVTGIIKGKSGLATIGGDHPQDLLPEPAGQFAHSVVK